MNVLLIDNYDSFTFNLAEEFKEQSCKVEIWRNDITANEAIEKALNMPAPRMILLSPGPGSPREAGCSIELVQKAQGKVPVLGICLGHQAIVESFGGKVGSAQSIVHGKFSLIEHDGQDIFSGLPSPLKVGRYHSLVATSLPDVLQVRASFQNIVMAVSHEKYPIVGLQFHPESILTPMGKELTANIINHFTKQEVL